MSMYTIRKEEIALKKDPHGRLKSVNAETKGILQELERDYKAPEFKETPNEVADKFNAAHYSTGAVAASFTSTAMVPETVHKAAIISEDEVKYDRVKKKAEAHRIPAETYGDNALSDTTCRNWFRRLKNNDFELEDKERSGALIKFEDGKLEELLDQDRGMIQKQGHLILYELKPRDVERCFLTCAMKSGYTMIIESVENCGIQGGDPTGTGLGGESIWNKPFEDEIKPNLHHSGRGVLSMANSGPNTNGSQFFITFRSCKQLNGKHTIFGKLVGGMDTLQAMEQIEVDNKDRPIQDIIIEGAQVFVDPFAEAAEQLANERLEELKRKAEAEDPGIKPKKASNQPLKVFREGVGKYLNLQELTNVNKGNKNEEVPTKKSKKETNYKFGSFDSW
ncbi:Peptidyl-prolyl cis-trans isomerase-like 2 [Eumeta japonica]|uniref:Peptidyl-prolyl cis-trans isomerase-like 2 n=1 Tax=Eumeta variegata TaxID=151549 RepID=A0A4C1UJL6_EUMVA|nr:Peptidyl-prolyl cis-trans isomerase-like 2 [Eumeta japonica]